MTFKPKFSELGKELVKELKKESLKEDDKKIQENNTALSVEEQKREDIKKEKTDNEYSKKIPTCLIFSPNYNHIELSKFSFGAKYLFCKTLFPSSSRP